MLESIFGHGPAQSAPAAAVVHDVVQVRLLGLMVVDTFRWKHAWAAWRIRFAIDNDVRDMAYAQITAFVRDQVVPHCTQRAECADIVLYLADLRDARTVIRLHGHTTQGPGLISSLQGSASYEQATAFAGELAAELRNGGIGEDAGLPDLHWTVTGAGLTRVATTKVDSLTASAPAAIRACGSWPSTTAPSARSSVPVAMRCPRWASARRWRHMASAPRPAPRRVQGSEWLSLGMIRPRPVQHECRTLAAKFCGTEPNR